MDSVKAVSPLHIVFLSKYYLNHIYNNHHHHKYSVSY